MEKESDEDSLWDDYIKSGSVKIRNKLFVFYMEWAKKVATIQFSRIRPLNLTWADSVQIGSLALLESLDRFNPSKGVPFEGFAIKRIKGALLNAAEKSKKPDERYGSDVFDITDGVSDFDVFVDGVLDVAYSGLLEVSSRKMSGKAYEPLQCFIDFREETLVREAVASLPEELKFIVKSHYFSCLTFSQIAKMLELSRARVSQLHQKALRNLQKIVEDQTKLGGK